MADVTKGWHAVFDKGSKQAQERLKKAHGNKPEFQAFLKSRGAEGGERSVKQASTSLKKSTETKVAAQKIADMRFKKALQASSERVKEMGRRRREGGEGLGGGLETARDVVAHVKKYGSIKAGRLGEGFDPEPADIAAELVKKHGKGKVTSKHLDAYEADRDTQKGLDREEIMKHVNKLSEETVNEVSKAEAEKVLGGAVKEKPKMPPGKQPAGYRYVRGLARKAMKAGLKKEEVEVIETPEVVVEQNDSMEKKEMAQTQLHFIKYAAEEILEFIDMGGEVEEWYQNKLSKVQSEVESLHSYVEGEKRRTGMVKEEEEQIDEKAPPGAKYERMVKHIKKGYAKGGLTPKEKSIAYATAWKAYKANEEIEQTDEATADWKRAFGAVATKNLAKDIGSMRTKTSRLRFVGMKPAVDTTPKVTAAVTKRGTYAEEVVAEAEGKVAVTPQEKTLAAKHGDKTKITYGDVIKARIQSAKEKALKGKE